MKYTLAPLLLALLRLPISTPAETVTWKLGDWAVVSAPRAYETGKTFPVKVELKKTAEAGHLHLDLSRLNENGSYGGFLAALGREEVSGPGTVTFQCTVRKHPENYGLANLTLYLTSDGTWGGRTEMAVMPLLPPGGKPDLWNNVAARLGDQPGAPAGQIDRTDRPPLPPMELDDAVHRSWMQKAPQPDFDLEEAGVRGRLIDFIDCTDPVDPHALVDQGTSRVVEGPAGSYRLSAPHKHGFFSYAYRTAGPGEMTLLLIEYPDDAERVFNFWTHDRQRPSRPHLSFDPSAGAFTGGEQPLSNGMQYLTLLHWPRNQWSPVIAVNQSRAGGGAAAARIWIYAVDELLPAIPQEEETPGRVLDLFFPATFLAKRDFFGWQDRESIRHLAQYCKWIGFNRVTMMTAMNESWGALMHVPAWGLNDKSDNLEDILSQLDAEGGVGFLAGMVFDGMYGQFKAPDGTPFSGLDPERQREMLLEGLTQIIERYGKHPSFHGFAFGSMEAPGFYDSLHKAGLVEAAVDHVHRLRPDLEVITYLGNPRLQYHIFMETTAHGHHYPSPRPAEIVADWEKSGGAWTKHLADQVLANWRGADRLHLAEDPAEGLQVYELIVADAHRLGGGYRYQPRTALTYDVWRSPEVSRRVDTPYAALFSFFDEGHMGLYEGLNFWHHKWWTAPEFNPSGALARRPWTLLQAHRDRLAISAGGWNVKTFGAAADLRRFARAFRTLPNKEMQKVEVSGSDLVTARWLREGTQRTVALVNRTPFTVQVSVDSTDVLLEPYGLQTRVDEGTGVPVVKVQPAPAYTAHVEARLDSFEEGLEALPPDLPEAYRRTLEEAQDLLPTHPWQADQTVGYGLSEEIKLRRRLLEGARIEAPLLEAAPVAGASLDEWPEGSSDYRSEDGSGIARHTFFVNSWTGPQDLSLRLRLGHDGENLYLGVLLRDNVDHANDSLNLWISRGEHREWMSENVKPSVNVSLRRQEGKHTGAAGFRYTAEQVDGGWLFSGLWPLDTLKPGPHPGILLIASDDDGEPNLDNKSWARKQTLLLPHDPTWEFWSDARNVGTLVLERK